MIFRLSASLSRIVIVVVALALAAAMCFLAGRMAWAAIRGEGEKGVELKAATRLEPRNPEYWYRLGHFQQFNLEDPDPAAAKESLRKAVALNPQFTDAWLDLGTTLELEGDTAGAKEAYKRAVKSYPGSAEVAWRYGNFLLRNGDFPASFEQLHRAIEIDPTRAAAAFSRVYRADPDMDEILGKVLPANAHVYGEVIREATAAKQLALAQLVWARLLALDPRLEISDFDPLVGALRENKEYAASRRVWEQGTARVKLPEMFRPQGSEVWDPSFESGINGHWSSWRYSPIDQGIQATLDTNEKLSGQQSLRIAFDGKQNPSKDIACTGVFVNPGTTYLFSAWVKARDLTTEQGVRFRLMSFSDQGVNTVNTEEYHGTMPWTAVNTTWKAAKDVHTAQICIGRDANDNPDMRISGNAWIDDVNLVPVTAEHEKP
jgi:Tetratricopeptide repeat